MKTRRHSNNKGLRQIKRGKTVDQVRHIARRLGVKFINAAKGRRVLDDSHGK